MADDAVDELWADELTITDADAIAMLTDRRALRFLVPFMSAEHTLSSVAAQLEKSPSTVAYWIPRLVRAGLLQQRDTVQRAGRAMPRYRAAALNFVIPYRLVPFDRRVALLDGGRYSVMHKLLDGVDEELARVKDFSLKISATGNGGFAVQTTESALERNRLALTDSWFKIRLTEDDARNFARELDAVYEKYMHRTGSKVYYGHVGLAREPRHNWRSVEPGTRG